MAGGAVGSHLQIWVAEECLCSSKIYMKPNPYCDDIGNFGR